MSRLAASLLFLGTLYAGAVSAAERKRRIQTAIDLLVKYHKPLVEAMDADFGGRPRGYSLMNDVLGSLTSLKYARDHFEPWMASEPRTPFPPYDQLGAQAWVMYQPKGTVGIIGTWNAPLFTLFSPLASALAAGNRAILKPSEVVSRTAQVVAEAVVDMFDPLEVGVVTGGPDMGEPAGRRFPDFLTGEVMPLVDGRYRTLPGQPNTGTVLVGSTCQFILDGKTETVHTFAGTVGINL